VLLEVGRIDKPHGVRGDVVVSLITERTERLAPGTVLDSDRGPLEVVEAKPHQHRWIVRFAGVVGREGADELRGVVLRAEALPDDDPDAIWVHEVIGRRIVDQHGTDHGEITAVQANPASDLLVLASGGLVPLRFVVDHADAEVVRVDVPDGLLDLP